VHLQAAALPSSHPSGQVQMALTCRTLQIMPGSPFGGKCAGCGFGGRGQTTINVRTMTSADVPDIWGGFFGSQVQNEIENGNENETATSAISPRNIYLWMLFNLLRFRNLWAARWKILACIIYCFHSVSFPLAVWIARKRCYNDSFLVWNLKLQYRLIEFFVAWAIS